MEEFEQWRECFDQLKRENTLSDRVSMRPHEAYRPPFGYELCVDGKSVTEPRTKADDITVLGIAADLEDAMETLRLEAPSDKRRDDNIS